MMKFCHGLVLNLLCLCAALCAVSAAGSARADEWKASEMATYEREMFLFCYPNSWTLAKHQDDFDPDRRITIDSKGQSHIVIEVLADGSRLDPNQVMAGLLLAYDGPAIEVLGRSEFAEWGAAKGRGMHLKGHILGVEPGGVRLFVAVVGQRGLVVTEYYFAEELADAMAGFDLIRQSLVFK